MGQFKAEYCSLDSRSRSHPQQSVSRTRDYESHRKQWSVISGQWSVKPEIPSPSPNVLKPDMRLWSGLPLCPLEAGARPRISCPETGVPNVPPTFLEYVEE